VVFFFLQKKTNKKKSQIRLFIEFLTKRFFPHFCNEHKKFFRRYFLLSIHKKKMILACSPFFSYTLFGAVELEH